MPRAIFLGALLAGLVGLAAVPSSAALPGSGRIAYAAFNDGLYTISPDGIDAVRLRPGPVSDPRWSPDGTKIAFSEYTGTIGEFRLVVMNADGTGEHVVVTTGSIVLGKQPWSPDGSRIAFAALDEIYTTSSAGGDVRRITSSGARKEPPSWSPMGATLVYAALIPTPSSGNWELFVARDDGTPPQQITSGASGAVQSLHPSWSPDGTTIAFLKQFGQAANSAIYVVHPDGTELHRVVDVSSASTGEPVWSPDGTKIAYTDAVNGFYSRYGGHAGQEIFSVGADGSSARRLTKLAPFGYTDASPAWSPDGDRILFLRPAGPAPQVIPVTMNADGTCVGALPVGAAIVYAAPSWQPVPGGAPAGEKTCRAVAVAGHGEPSRNRSKLYLYITVTNEGTEPLANVVVTISAPRHDLELEASGCSKRNGNLVCPLGLLGLLGRGQSRDLFVTAAARRVGRDQRGKDVSLRAQLHVTADGPLLPTQRETDVVPFTADTCSSSDPGRGRIDGTRFPDRICGRRGPDDIHPADGKDLVFAGAGPDRIFARDIYGDVIRCGPGRDIVIADRKDVVAHDCEQVRRG